MARYQGKRTPARRKGKGLFLLIAALLAVIVLAVVIFAWKSATRAEEEQPQETVQGNQAGEAENQASSALTFPYSPAEGVEINALFSSDLMNPDGGNVPVVQLASLEVTNTSDRYLTSAVFTVTLTDRTAYHFLVSDLPAGGRTVAFSTENAAYDGTDCAVIAVETAFAGGSQLMEESVSFSVDGTTVTLTNRTREALGPLSVICRDTLDDTEFFGGVSYAYRTESIPAGGSVTVEALDCLIGQPAVVRISRDG